MVKCLKVKKDVGEKAKRFLIQKGWLDRKRMMGRTAQKYLIFPLTAYFDEQLLLKKFDGKIEAKNLQLLKPSRTDLKASLKKVLPEKYLEEVIRSFDLIGNVAILNIPSKLKRFEKSIAWTLKRTQPAINIVAKKASKVKGRKRIRELKILAGNKNFITTYKEHGITMNMDLSKMYFSPRLAGERLRIAKQVKPGEEVLVMFAGIGPFALIIAKTQPRCKVWAVEINKDAVQYMKENIRINRVGYIIKPIKGDVRKEVPKLNKQYDRIIMILPEEGEAYLDLALAHSRKGTKIHFYKFIHENDFEKDLEKMKQYAKNFGKNVKIFNWERAGTYGPRIYRWCIELQVK